MIFEIRQSTIKNGGPDARNAFELDESLHVSVLGNTKTPVAENGVLS